MDNVRFIKIKGIDGKNTRYFVPRMYKLSGGIIGLKVGLKIFGFQYIKDILTGWTICYTDKKYFDQAIKTLDELRKTRIFTYKVLRRMD